MRLALVAAISLACAGCPADEVDDYPVIPGGGGPGGSGSGMPLEDAGASTGDG
nr:hypothetical protein [Deltaproteobacteria bacterium]